MFDDAYCVFYNITYLLILNQSLSNLWYVYIAFINTLISVTILKSLALVDQQCNSVFVYLAKKLVKYLLDTAKLPLKFTYPLINIINNKNIPFK